MLTLQRQYKPSLALHHVRYHVINEAMLVPDVLLFKLRFVLSLIQFFEDCDESAIVLFHHVILRGNI